jgi:transposase
MFCSGCARRCRVAYVRRIMRWRHLDLARTRCVLRCEVRRVACPECGIRSEQVPWARAGSRFTRGFEDTCVFLARAAPKVVVAELQSLLSVITLTCGRVRVRLPT